tara:strand:+ start:1311 stop:1460 length:150 start_codon:yes stop_codon:yes gene_type:complete
VIKTISFPVRVTLGLAKAIETNMPDTLDIPFEIKRKETTNGTSKEKPRD